MVVTGEVFIDPAMYERSLRAAFAHATRVHWMQVGAISVVPIVLTLVFFWPMTIVYLMIMVATQPYVPWLARRVSVAQYRRAGPGMWHYQVDDFGFRIVGPLGIASGQWRRLTSITENVEFWVVRPRFTRYGVALPKAAFTPADIPHIFAGTMAV
jgi:hypothetical protein